jgi:hypothetical protein
MKLVGKNMTMYGTENVNLGFKPVTDFYVEKIFSSSFQQTKINGTMKVLLVVLLIMELHAT